MYWAVQPERPPTDTAFLLSLLRQSVLLHWCFVTRRYIHDYHVTWVKDQAAVATGATAIPAPAAVMPDGRALGERVRQELPSDPMTQVCCEV